MCTTCGCGNGDALIEGKTVGREAGQDGAHKSILTTTTTAPPPGRRPMRRSRRLLGNTGARPMLQARTGIATATAPGIATFTVVAVPTASRRRSSPARAPRATRRALRPRA